jgi:hypothetical protein
MTDPVIAADGFSYGDCYHFSCRIVFQFPVPALHPILATLQTDNRQHAHLLLDLLSI